MQRAARAIRRLTRFMAAVAGLATVALMLLTVIDVARREFGGTGVPGTIEWTEVILVAAVFAALAAAEADGTHVRTPILVSRLRGRSQHVVRLFGLGASLALVVWMTGLTLGDGLDAVRTGEYRFGIQNVPVWPAKLLVPIGLGCLALELLIKVVEAVPGALGRSAPVDAEPEGGVGAL